MKTVCVKCVLRCIVGTYMYMDILYAVITYFCNVHTAYVYILIFVCIHALHINVYVLVSCGAFGVIYFCDKTLPDKKRKHK